MSLAPFIRALGRGPSRSRALTQDEARAAMEIILVGEAEPEAIGAFLMLLRLRGESAPEVAGFVEAVRSSLSDWHEIDARVDWPSYAAGRTRGNPYFLLSAKLVARAGFPVLLHGWNSHQQGVASVRAALAPLKISFCNTRDETRVAIERNGIAYVPLETLNASLYLLLKLRDTLGLRSIINTVVRMMNPANSDTSLQGVFHPSYRTLQSEVGCIVDQHSQAIIKGGGGEFERHPAKLVTLSRVWKGRAFDESVEPLVEEVRRLHDESASMPSASALWQGHESDHFAEAIVTGTAALALATVNPAMSNAEAQLWAEELWGARFSASATDGRRAR